jgi:predicted DNA-binding transcriptional regulator AlpA
MSKPEDKPMSMKEACAALGISEATMYRRIKDGEIKPIPKPSVLKRAHRLEFDRAHIEAKKRGE